MLKNEKSANRNEHQNRKTEVFWHKNRKTDLKNWQSRKTENSNLFSSDSDAPVNARLYIQEFSFSLLFCQDSPYPPMAK